jgi:hypothetical protein
MSEKIDVLDLIIEVLRMHEKDLDERIRQIDNLISRLEFLLQKQKEILKKQGVRL